MANSDFLSASVISVLMPVNRDAQHVSEIAREIEEHMKQEGLEYELLCLTTTIDPDVTRQLDEARDGLGHRIRVMQFSGVTDEGAVLSAGAEQAQGSIIVTLPARFEIAISEIDGLIAGVKEGADVVTASRQNGATGAASRLQSRFFNRLLSVAAGARFEDLASGTRAMNSKVLAEVPLYGDFHRYLPILAQRLGFDVQERPSQQHPEAKPRTIHSPLVYLWRAIDVLTVFFISRFTRHPLRLFGGIGAAFAVSGSVALLALAMQRLGGVALADRPILILPVLLVGLGFQSFAIGLLGELILFFQARRIRDYRVSAIHQAAPAGYEAEELTSRG
jgi:hypothetical protein